MAVEWVHEKFQQQRGTWDIQSRRYTRTFEIKVTALRDGVLTAMTAVDPTTGLTIPSIGDMYVEGEGGIITDPMSLAKSVVPNRSAKDELLWDVVVEYDNEFPTDSQQPGGAGTGGGEPGQPPTSPAAREANPLNRPTEWKRAGVVVKKAIDKDLNDDAIVNSALDYFSPPYEVERTLARWTAVKNYESFTEADCQDFEGRYNDAAWHQWPEAAAKVETISLDGAYENGFSYVRATWTILYDPELWQPILILDRGYQDINGAPFLDKATSRVEKPLDGAGLEGDPEDPQYLMFSFFYSFDATDPRLP